MHTPHVIVLLKWNFHRDAIYIYADIPTPYIYVCVIAVNLKFLNLLSFSGFSQENCKYLYPAKILQFHIFSFGLQNKTSWAIFVFNITAP